MPVRRATAADIPIMAKIVATAFDTDSLFKVIFPFTPQYPEDFERARRENLWLSWYDYRKVMMVSYEYELKDDVKSQLEQGQAEELQALMSSAAERPAAKRMVETITGMAVWQRSGQGSFRTRGLWRFLGLRKLEKTIFETLLFMKRCISNMCTSPPNEASTIDLLSHPEVLHPQQGRNPSNHGESSTCHVLDAGLVTWAVRVTVLQRTTPQDALVASNSRRTSELPRSRLRDGARRAWTGNVEI